MENNKSWKVTMLKGYGQPIIVEAENEDDAKLIALGIFRFEYGADGVLSRHRTSDIIKSVEKL